MCGIWSSKRRNMFEVLYDANSTRGTFATGVIQLKELKHSTIKRQGVIDFDKVALDETSEYYIGHAQAPTSRVRQWELGTSHPFETSSWAVVHNGVLTNSTALADEYLPNHKNPVDTSIISELLQHFTEQATTVQPGHSIIKQVLELIEGTFALIIVDTDSNEVYLARQGSMLHINDKGDASTMTGKDFVEVAEGAILNLQGDKWVQVDTFKQRSPFLFV